MSIKKLKKCFLEKEISLKKEQRLKEQKDAALKSKMEEIIKTMINNCVEHDFPFPDFPLACFSPGTASLSSCVISSL